LALDLTGYDATPGTVRIAEHSPGDHARLNGIIFFAGLFHHPTNSWHILHSNSILELAVGIGKDFLFHSRLFALPAQYLLATNRSRRGICRIQFLVLNWLPYGIFLTELSI